MVVVVVIAVVVDLEVNHSRMNRRRQAIITRDPRTFSVLPEGFSRVGRRSTPSLVLVRPDRKIGGRTANGAKGMGATVGRANGVEE